MSKFSKRRVRYLRGRIRVLRDRGLSWREIALRLHISERSVYRLKAAGKGVTVDMPMLFPQGTARPSKATKEFAVRCVGFGLPLSIVGWLVGVQGNTVARWRVSEKKSETD